MFSDKVNENVRKVIIFSFVYFLKLSHTTTHDVTAVVVEVSVWRGCIQ